MHPKKIWANMAVSDLQRTAAFYTRLGFTPNGPNKSADLVSFLFGDDKLVIHFFIKKVFEANTQVPITDKVQTSEVMFTLSAESRADVDHWAEEVKAAGGEVLSGPEAFGDDYYGFVFADPDGHKFNVFHM